MNFANNNPKVHDDPIAIALLKPINLKVVLT